MKPRYRIITGQNVDNLADKVRTALAHGYVPQGGVVINGMTYAQAVYLPDTKEPRP